MPSAWSSAMSSYDFGECQNAARTETPLRRHRPTKDASSRERSIRCPFRCLTTFPFRRLLSDVFGHCSQRPFLNKIYVNMPLPIIHVDYDVFINPRSLNMYRFYVRCQHITNKRCAGVSACRLVLACMSCPCVRECVHVMFLRAYSARCAFRRMHDAVVRVYLATIR